LLSPTALSGSPDDEELGQAAGNVHLHLDRARLQPQECDRGDLRDHVRLSPPWWPTILAERNANVEACIFGCEVNLVQDCPFQRR
jgi:hypothetical protein